jgi:hypothetical protein
MMTNLGRPDLRNFLLAATMLASPLIAPLIAMAPTPAAAQVSVGIALPSISVQIAPPVLPVYVQPPMPAVGYLWTPGYWAWTADAGYYWVPGTWVQPPTVGVLWTPPYWGWVGGNYIFHDGYWGPHIGFYGGVNYGFGYGGIGYEGGQWNGGVFSYNRAANNFGSTQVTNVYEKNVTVINNNHVSYVGGAGGLTTQPTAEERQAETEHHVAPTAEQTTHITAAAKNPDLAASHNGGHPAIAATSRPGQFTGPGVVHAAPAAAHVTAPGPASHPGVASHPAAAGTAHPAPGHPVATNAAPAAAGTAHPAPAPHPAAAAPARPAPAHAPVAAAAHPAAAPHPAAAAPHPAAAAPHPAASHPAPAEQKKPPA